MVLSVVVRQGAKLYASSPISQHILSNGRACFSIGSGLSNGMVSRTNLLRPQLLSQKISKRMMSADHAKKWKLEKLLTIIMFPIIPATFNNPGTEMLDNLFAVLVTTHAHFGLTAITKDYIRPIIFGPLIPKIATILVYSLTGLTLGSLLYFNHHNVGIGAAGRKIWSIGKKREVEEVVEEEVKQEIVC